MDLSLCLWIAVDFADMRRHGMLEITCVDGVNMTKAMFFA